MHPTCHDVTVTCMLACRIYIYMYVCMYTNVPYVCMHACRQCMYNYMYVCMYACIHRFPTYMYVCMHVDNVCIIICMHVCVHTDSHSLPSSEQVHRSTQWADRSSYTSPQSLHQCTTDGRTSKSDSCSNQQTKDMRYTYSTCGCAGIYYSNRSTDRFKNHRQRPASAGLTKIKEEFLCFYRACLSFCSTPSASIQP